MSSPPAGISEANWQANPVACGALIFPQQQEIELLCSKHTALATKLTSLRKRIARYSRNSSNPPSSDGSGFKPPEQRKGSDHVRGGQPCNPRSGPELLPIERVDEVLKQHPGACHSCGPLLQEDDPKPWRCQVI